MIHNKVSLASKTAIAMKHTVVSKGVRKRRSSRDSAINSPDGMVAFKLGVLQTPQLLLNLLNQVRSPVAKPATEL